jgi:hypothetical protein
MFSTKLKIPLKGSYFETVEDSQSSTERTCRECFPALFSGMVEKFRYVHEIRRVLGRWRYQLLPLTIRLVIA